MNKTIYDNIKNGKYDNLLPHLNANNKRDDYSNKNHELAKEFRKDVEEVFLTKDHILAESLWNKTWKDHVGVGRECWLSCLKNYEELVEFFIVPLRDQANSLLTPVP